MAMKLNFAAMKAKAAEALAASRRKPLKATDVKGDPLKGVRLDPDRPLEAMDQAVRATEEAATEHRTSIASAAQGEAKSTQRMIETNYYCVIVFDTNAQCEAFTSGLRLKVHLTERGNIFLDGREIAQALGIPIPDAEYTLPKKAFKATGQTARHETLVTKKKGKA